MDATNVSSPGGNEPAEVEEVLEGLRAGTTYRYRLVAFYGHGASYGHGKRVFGDERSLTTKPLSIAG